MKRIVLDTNSLIASAYNVDSASRKIVDAALRGDVTVIVSPAIKREYARILPNAVRVPYQLERLETLISQAEEVDPDSRERLVPEDPEDDKFLHAAVEGNADALITNDQGVLDVGSHEGIEIVEPSRFVRGGEL